uniref:Uncharacterized protein n=1 Tax=Aegilops tauschii subsp. strangulata TaxID=200361 RepID=A0A453L5N6_AEGTS
MYYEYYMHKKDRIFFLGKRTMKMKLFLESKVTFLYQISPSSMGAGYCITWSLITCTSQSRKPFLVLFIETGC